MIEDFFTALLIALFLSPVAVLAYLLARKVWTAFTRGQTRCRSGESRRVSGGYPWGQPEPEPETYGDDGGRPTAPDTGSGLLEKDNPQ